MPNHVDNVLIVMPTDREAFDFRSFQRQWSSGLNLCEELRPQPRELNDPCRPTVLTEAAYQWQRREWGCKWGTYRHGAYELPGDCGAVVLVFCTPDWGLCDSMRQDVRHWLHKHYLRLDSWVECDPADGVSLAVEVPS